MAYMKDLEACVVTALMRHHVRLKCYGHLRSPCCTTAQDVIKEPTRPGGAVSGADWGSIMFTEIRSALVQGYVRR